LDRNAGEIVKKYAVFVSFASFYKVLWHFKAVYERIIHTGNGFLVLKY